MSITAAVRAAFTRLGLDRQADVTTRDVYRLQGLLAGQSIGATPAQIIQALVDIDKLRPTPAHSAATSTIDAPRTHGGARNAMIEVRMSVPPTPVETTKMAIAKAFAAVGLPISHLVGDGPRSRTVNVYVDMPFEKPKAALNAMGFTEAPVADDWGASRMAHRDPSTGVAIYLVRENAHFGGRDI